MRLILLLVLLALPGCLVLPVIAVGQAAVSHQAIAPVIAKQVAKHKGKEILKKKWKERKEAKKKAQEGSDAEGESGSTNQPVAP